MHVEGLLRCVSEDGVWIYGLPPHERRTLHFTAQELASDLRSKGPFYQYVFTFHQNPEFILVPDCAGRICKILLASAD
jgi:hypothetical protein